MTYETPHALRTALEQRLLNRSRATGVALDRLRRRVLFERILARIQAAEPGKWVLKGGMALEVRLDTEARVTKDIDRGLREERFMHRTSSMIGSYAPSVQTLTAMGLSWRHHHRTRAARTALVC